MQINFSSQYFITYFMKKKFYAHKWKKILTYFFVDLWFKSENLYTNTYNIIDNIKH